MDSHINSAFHPLNKFRGIPGEDLNTKKEERYMICVICDSELFEAESCEQYNVDSKTVIIGKIPVLKCPRCGETYYGNEILDRIDAIISEIRHQEAFRKMPQTLVCC